MARTSSIYDHVIIWPSSVTLIFNLPQQMFQMVLLLVRENNCANLFWNLCTNVQVMAQTYPDGCMHKQHTMHTCTHIPVHRTEVVTTISRSPQVGLTKKCQEVWFFFKNIFIGGTDVKTILNLHAGQTVYNLSIWGIYIVTNKPLNHATLIN